jgi:hypothetical protein
LPWQGFAWNFVNKKTIKNSRLTIANITEKRLSLLVQPLLFVKDKIVDREFQTLRRNTGRFGKVISALFLTGLAH